MKGMNKMSQKIQKLFLLVFALCLIGCSNTSVVSEDVPVEQVEDIGVASNDLGFSVFSTIDKIEGENVFISPTSLYVALLLAYNGVEGETKAEFRDTLQMTDWTDTEVNEAMHVLLDSFRSEEHTSELQ